MSHVLGLVAARNAADRLEGLEAPHREAVMQVITSLNEDGRARVRELLTALYPRLPTSDALEQFDRLVAAVNQAADGTGNLLRMCITPDRNAAVRWVWFEGPAAPVPEPVEEWPEGDDPLETVVILTFNPHETKAIWKEFTGSTMSPSNEKRNGRSYYKLGVVGGTGIIHAWSPQTTGEAQHSAHLAIEEWGPVAVVAAGIAFGTDPDKERLHDVLVASSVLNYQQVKVQADGTATLRSFPRAASERFLTRVGDLELEHTDDIRWPTIHQGIVLSGDNLVDNEEYRDTLRARHDQIVGGEMEGSGIERACRDEIRWALIKAICDWGAGKETPHKDRDQMIAAASAAKVVRAVLSGGWLRQTGKHRRPVRPDSPTAPQTETSSVAASGQPPAPSSMGHMDPVVDSPRVQNSLAAPISLSQGTTSDGDQKTPALDALAQWAAQPEGPPLFALLGEYGMGKTVTAQRLARTLSERRAEDPTLPIPLYFDLKKIASPREATDLQTVVTTCMRDGWLPKYSPDYTWERFVGWLSTTTCLVIFDGLDELLVKFNQRLGDATTQRLLGVLDVVPPDRRVQTKVLLTCRTHYFPTLRAQRTHFLLRDRSDLKADSYRAMVLLPFAEEQIRSYLAQAIPSTPVDTVLDMVHSIHNLSELSKRP